MIRDIPIMFIVGAGRTGSGFFASLLDSHEQVLMLPMELKFYCEWKELQCDQLEYTNELARRWLTGTKLKFFKGGLHQNHEKNQFTNCDFETFSKLFRQYLAQGPINRRNTFYAIHQAYTQSIGQDLSKVKYIVEFSAIHIDVDYALEDFPQVKFIEVARDQRGNYASYKQWYLNSRRGLVDFVEK